MYLHICIYHTQVTRSQAPPIPLRSCWTLIRGTNMTMPCHDCVMILVTCLVNVHRSPSSWISEFQRGVPTTSNMNGKPSFHWEFAVTNLHGHSVIGQSMWADVSKSKSPYWQCQQHSLQFGCNGWRGFHNHEFSEHDRPLWRRTKSCKALKRASLMPPRWTQGG